MSPGDLRENARGFEPRDLLVEPTRMIDLRVDRRHIVRVIDWLNDVGEDEAAARVERPRNSPQEKLSRFIIAKP